LTLVDKKRNVEELVNAKKWSSGIESLGTRGWTQFLNSVRTRRLCSCVNSCVNSGNSIVTCWKSRRAKELVQSLPLLLKSLRRLPIVTSVGGDHAHEFDTPWQRSSIKDFVSSTMMRAEKSGGFCTKHQ
jgi:hypothetical protein